MGKGKMRMNKTYKRVPFDIELAKKIQSGEVEGRIVTVNGELVRVLTFDIKDNLPAVVVVTRPNGNETVYTCTSTGKDLDGYNNSTYDIQIELPEETPKHEFKVGDVVKVTPQDGKHSEWIIGFGPVIARVLCQTPEGVLLENKGGFIDMFSLDEIQFITDASHDSTHEFKVGDKVQVNGSEMVFEIYKIEGKDVLLKNVKEMHLGSYWYTLDQLRLYIEKHEFKPFDKVLVRDDEEEIWQPRLYEMYYEETKKHYCQDGRGYIECIPYEGNEHLVGTTNESK